MTVHTPIESRRGGLPPWAAVLTVFVFLVGGVYLVTNLAGENPAYAPPGQSRGPVASGGADGTEALAIIEPAGCQACHGTDLGGQGQFPSLHNVAEGPTSENLQDLAAEHPDDWIALWIAGTDEAVQGIDRGGMPVFGEQLSPEEIETIVTYLKSL